MNYLEKGLWYSVSKNKEILLRGPGYLNRKLCNNADDFLTFEEIENSAREAGFIIYKGKCTGIETFRVGCMGDLKIKDIEINSVKKAYLKYVFLKLKIII